MKKLLIVLLATVFVLGISLGVAYAVDPVPADDTPYTFVETASDTSVPSVGFSDTFRPEAWRMGASAWRYGDAQDATYKYEGSYRKFDVTTGIGLYTVNPHGGYDTTSNKCKTCHAVHRASGAFKLMRVDNPDDACSYCHVGSHRHATLQAYSGGAGTIYPVNGHTIDSGKSIPDSSVSQWLANKTLSSGDYYDGNYQNNITLEVRRYEPKKLRLWVWTAVRSAYHVSWKRYGPTLLTCMSCHQPHNADDLVWKPDGVSKFRLLRAAPSGSVKSTADMALDAGESEYGYDWYSDFVAGNLGTGLDGAALQTAQIAAGTAAFSNVAVTAVQGTLNAANTVTLTSANGANAGVNPTPAKTIYTQWKDGGLATETVAIDTTRLSVWCADCHNLDIGRPERNTQPNFRGGERGEFHSDRTHSVPFRGGSTGLECYSCHRGDMETTENTRLGGAAPTSVGCNRCHYGTGATWGNAARTTGWLATSDFPHSGASTSTKLLPNWYDASYEHLDVICSKCHDLIGKQM